jgi:hypothetical protein
MTAESGFVYTQLCDSDTTKFADTLEEAPISTSGDVFVYIPKFWTKCTSTDSDHFTYEVAIHEKPDDDWIEWGDTFIGAYDGYVNDNKLYSRSGFLVSSGNTQELMKKYSRNRGNGYSLITYQQHCLIALLFYFYYGNTDSDSVLYSYVNFNEEVGETNSLGMTDTCLGNGFEINNFWGIENIFGGIGEYIDNVQLSAYTWTVRDYEGNVIRKLSKRETYYPDGGYITKLAFGDYFDMFPLSLSGGSSSTYFCDYSYTNFDGYGILLRKFGHWGTFSYVYRGVSYISSYLADSVKYSAGGSRLAYNGESTYVSSDKFMSLTEV